MQWMWVLVGAHLLVSAVTLFVVFKLRYDTQRQLSFAVSALASLQRIVLNEVKVPILEALAPHVQHKPEPKKDTRQPVSLEEFGGE
jgi:hypothetical protein